MDYLDLDGAELIGNDSCLGMKFENGRLTLPEKPGLGVEKLSPKVREYMEI